MQVCNHRFHSECLQKWGDSSCPVCRYSINAHHDSRCQACGATGDLWMCLLCGHVGCGRYQAAHARDHYVATDHCYALEVNTGRVRHPSLARDPMFMTTVVRNICAVCAAVKHM